MTLLELCEPLFQYVCMLNRISRNPGGEQMDHAPLRKAIDGVFAQMREQAEGDSRLATQLKKVEMLDERDQAQGKPVFGGLAPGPRYSRRPSPFTPRSRVGRGIAGTFPLTRPPR